MTPLRVVHVITTLTTGGAERQLELLARRSGSAITIVALYGGGPVADSLRAAGHHVIILGMAGPWKYLAWFRLARLLRRLRPDVVHVHLLAAQLWGIPAAVLARVPVIVSSEHSLMDETIEGRPYSRWLQVLYRLLERMTTRTVAVSPATAARLRKWRIPVARIVVINNGIDFRAVEFSQGIRAEVRTELGAGPDTLVIGAVARLDPVKRLDALLSACAPRLRDGRHLLVIAGTGVAQADLRQLADHLQVSSSIRWLGARPDVPRLLNGFDVLISASRDETFGMAVVEALGNGLPVVYQQCPALDHLPHRPAQAVPVALHSSLPADWSADSDEVSALRLALDQACALTDERHEVPAELIDRYDAARAAQAVDRLHLHLTQRSALPAAERG